LRLARSEKIKSFLLLFFKKEVLSWPSGPALRLLEDPNKPESPVVQVRRGIERAA
jgi:hypothetical protein